MSQRRGVCGGGDRKRSACVLPSSALISLLPLSAFACGQVRSCHGCPGNKEKGQTGDSCRVLMSPLLSLHCFSYVSRRRQQEKGEMTISREKRKKGKRERVSGSQ